VEEGGFELAVPDRARFAVGVIEIAKAGIGIALEDPGIADEMPVARVEERPWRRVRAGERPIVPDIRGPHERADSRCRQPAR
jgi:hypothetical protein